MRFDRVESGADGVLRIYFKDEVIATMFLARQYELPELRKQRINPMEGKKRWYRKTLMTGQQSTDEDYQIKLKIA